MIDYPDVEQVIAAFGSLCSVANTDTGETRDGVRMVVRDETRGRARTGDIFSRIVDGLEERRGATYGYGLLLANDAPQGMNEKTRLTVTDSLAREWHMDTARAVMKSDAATGELKVVAWRLVLWRQQRAVTR